MYCFICFYIFGIVESFFSIIMIESTLLMPVKSYLERKTTDKTLTVMDWPPQSPDLNIIQAVWDHLDRERNKGQPKSKEDLWEVLKEALYNIPEYYERTSRQSPKKCCIGRSH